MRHEFLVLTVKKLLKSVYIYGSYRKNKIGVPFLLDHPVGPPQYHCIFQMSLYHLYSLFSHRFLSHTVTLSPIHSKLTFISVQ